MTRFHVEPLSTLGAGGPGEDSAPIALTAFPALPAFLLRCKRRSILGTGFLTVGLGANTSPRLHGVTHELLALAGGNSCATPGNGLFGEKQFPGLHWQLREINGQTIFHQALRVRCLLRCRREVETHRLAFVSMVSKH